MKWNAENTFDVLIILFAGAFMIIALGYDPAPARLPLAVGGATVIFAVFHLLMDIRKQNVSHKASDDTPKFPQGLERLRLLLILTWLLGFFIVTAILGLTWSILIFLFTLLRFYFQESWLTTVTLSIGAWAAVYVLFVIIFEIDLYRGYLFN